MELGMKTDWFRVALKEEANKFSVESVFYPTPWGVHKPRPSIKGAEFAQLLRACPELSHIVWPPLYMFGDTLANYIPSI